MNRTSFAGSQRLLARFILGAAFIYAGFIKTISPENFADGISAYRILPSSCVNLMALSLPPFEIMLGVWLLTGWRLRPAAFCAAVTLLVFLGAMAAADLRGLQVDCACFGSSGTNAGQGNGSLALGRDLMLAAAALYLYVAERSRPPLGA